MTFKLIAYLVLRKISESPFTDCITYASILLSSQNRVSNRQLRI